MAPNVTTKIVSPPAKTEKRGGYSGGQSANTVGPPAKVPSATIKPAKADK